MLVVLTVAVGSNGGRKGRREVSASFFFYSIFRNAHTIYSTLLVLDLLYRKVGVVKTGGDN